MSRQSVAPKAPPAKMPAALTDEQLGTLRLNLDGRQQIVDDLVRRLRAVLPGFGRRPMTYDDALDAVHQKGLRLDVGQRFRCRDARGREQLTLVVGPGLLEPYLVFAIFHQLAHFEGHEDRSFEDGTAGLCELEADSIAYLAHVGEPAGAPYPIVVSNDVVDDVDGEKGLRIKARHAVRGRRGQVEGWEHRELELRRYVDAPEKLPAWTDEWVLRVLRAQRLAHEVLHGRAKVGYHGRALKDFSTALASFERLVDRGEKEIRRRGHRDLVKANAFLHAVKASAGLKGSDG